ncbi:hypothetical protein GURASL_13790 [Geotalea uraniireducens]|uniref:CheR-type methyltransferase domain-containing protein n=1 Tax=Geotalea uraniireducens TaxID=351604 RepID=A0ABN6VTD2_9BACT|nr:CheR family methyltransferase [Geotalea uraniireducens]BDV42456.1 hypothetical protein GURASL_13790 [Geotalea uraniireducens]
MAFSFFMRDQQILERAADHLIPAVAGRSRIRIWDAGCALGQETWTVAMILAERMHPFGFKNLRIDATDYDQANRFGEVVSRAIYAHDDLKRLPPELLEKYFEAAEVSGSRRVKALLRERITFQYHDLLSLRPIGSNYCLIVCKNVLLHFSPQQRVEVLRMFHGALAPGGYFVCENTQKMPGELAPLFEQVTADAPVYQKRV